VTPSPILRIAVVLLTAGAWIALEGSSVSAADKEKPLQFVDCVKACIHRMELAKAECASQEKPAHNFDANKCVLNTEDHVVDCIQACTPNTK
jgi:hypothetical protein